MDKAKNAFQNASSKMPKSGPSLPILPLLGVGGLAYAAWNSIYQVKGGERAVIWNRLSGISRDSRATGMHFRIPLIDYPIIFDVRTRPRNVSTLTGSKDLQMVSITLRVLTKPDEHYLPTIYRELGTDYDDRVLPSIVNEVAKAVMANYNAAELLTRRAGVAREIEDELRKRAQGFNLVMEDVSITHLTFSPAYEQAVEAKQVAQQESQRARYIVEKALMEKKSIVIKSKGEAESAKLIGNSIKNNPGFIQLRRIEAAKDIAEVVNKSPNKLFLSADSLMLNVMNSDDGYDQKFGKRR
jgi:prohibitin 2